MSLPVCLITPPSPFLLDQRVFVSLGILRVAACLELAGLAVEHLDLSGITNYEEAAADHMAQSAAVNVGFTATTPQMPAAVRIAGAIREVRPDARIILGGPHPTLVNAAYKQEVRRARQGRALRAMKRLYDFFDVLVCGDGDDAIFEALKPDAPKLVDGDDPKGPLFLTDNRYSEIPFPARHLVNMDSYRYTIDGSPALSLVAQLGCPFACAFCGGRASPMLRRIRTRNTDSIIAEIRELYERYETTGIMFYDDELNVSKHIVKLMDGIALLSSELDVSFGLRGFIKAELFTDEQAQAMRRAGFRWILVGFESGSPRILENINKKSTREENTRCLQIAHKHGIKVKALMSIGHAAESKETIMETKEWLLENHPDDFDATVITTYPGAPYHDEAQETAPGIWTFTARNGDRLHAQEIDFLSEAAFYKGQPGDYRSFVWTDHLSAEQLVKLRDNLESEVREKLGIPFNQSASAIQYEHSMGMGLPDHILRQSKGAVCV